MKNSLWTKWQALYETKDKHYIKQMITYKLWQAQYTNQWQIKHEINDKHFTWIQWQTQNTVPVSKQEFESMTIEVQEVHCKHKMWN